MSNTTPISGRFHLGTMSLSRAEFRAVGETHREIISSIARMLVRPRNAEESRLAATVNKRLGWPIVNLAKYAPDNILLDPSRFVGTFQGRGATGQDAKIAVIVPNAGQQLTATQIFSDEYDLARRLEAHRVLPRVYCGFSLNYDPTRDSLSHGMGRPIRIPVLIREFIEGKSLGQLQRDNKLAPQHLRAIGELFGRMLGFESEVLPNNIVADHVIFEVKDDAIRARVCNVYQVREKCQPLDLLKHALDALLTPHRLTGAEQLRSFLHGFQPAAPAHKLSFILREAKIESGQVAGQLNELETLPADQKQWQEAKIERLKLWQKFLTEISTLSA
jgi:hypothetical protein